MPAKPEVEFKYSGRLFFQSGSKYVEICWRSIWLIRAAGRRISWNFISNKLITLLAKLCHSEILSVATKYGMTVNRIKNSVRRKFRKFCILFYFCRSIYFFICKLTFSL